MNSDRNDPALIRAAQQGDATARNRLILANLGLIYTAIHRCIKPGEDAAEHLAAGVTAFVRALECYRFDRGTSLAHYAMVTMVQQVRHARTQDRQTIRIPQLDHTSAPSRVAAGNKARHLLSVDAANDKGRPLLADLPSQADLPTERTERLEQLHAALAKLDHRERQILILRAHGLTLRAIAERLNLSKERVRQVEAAALAAAKAHALNHTKAA